MPFSFAGHWNIPLVAGWTGKQLPRSPADHGHFDGILEKCEASLFKHAMPFFPGNFEAVGARRLTGAGDKTPGGTIGIFQKSVDLVFHLNRMIFPQADMSGDAPWQPHKPLQ